jgi:predicted nucleic acid-binding protein
MTVVSNTTPLNYLILIGRAEILSVLYEAVVIPGAVLSELTSPKTPNVVKDWILNKPDWLKVEETPQIVDSKLDEIQIGERQAIVLAQQIQPEFIVLDDRRARRLAYDRGLNVIGTLGILTTAAEKGLITLRETLADLKQTNFRVSSSLLESLTDEDRDWQ